MENMECMEVDLGSKFDAQAIRLSRSFDESNILSLISCLINGIWSFDQTSGKYGRTQYQE